MYFRVSVLSFLISCTAFGQSYTIGTFAGGPPHPAAQARNAAIGNPAGVAVDSNGSIYFFSRNCVFKADSTGALTRIAGNYTAGYSGDGGPATSAQIHMPLVANAAIGNLQVYGNLAVDAGGDVYIPDPFANRVRKVSPAGVITTVAGNGSSYSGIFTAAGDGGPAANAELTSPHHVVVDGDGNLYISEARIRKVTPDGIIHTVTTASFYWGIAVDQTGSVYGARYNLVQKIAPDGTVTTLLSGAQAGNATDLALDARGNLYISDVSADYIHKLSSAGTVTTTAGNGNWGFAGDGIPATASPIAPEGLATDAVGNLYVADYDAGRIRKIDTSGTISTVAGNGGQWFEGDGGPAIDAVLSSPGQLAVDKAGNVYIADRLNNRIRKVAADGTITTVAGNGSDTSSGDGGPAVNAGLVYPSGLTFDGAGNLYTSDLGGGLRKISTGGIIAALPGSPLNSSPPPPAARPLVAENTIAADSKGNLYFIGNGIQSLSPAGTLSTISGITYYYGGLGIDAADTLYYSQIYTADIIGEQFANGTYGGVTIDTGCGSGGSALGFDPYGLAIDKSGNVFVTDLNGSTVRRITPSGTMETIAGNFTSGYFGDGGPATSAQLDQPASIAVDAAGNIYISDPIDNVVRVLRPSAQPPVAIAGVLNGASYLGGLAPGEIIVIFGSGLGPQPLVACESQTQGLVTRLNETQVYIDGVPAPLLYTSANQIAAVVPYEIGPGLSLSVAHMSVTFENGTSMAYPVAVTASAPGIFTADESGQGQAAAINQDGTFNGSGSLRIGVSNPAKPGEYISLYATGQGQTFPAGVDGQLAQTPLPQPLLPVTVTVGGQIVLPQYAGAAPGYAGLMQVNVQIPAGTPSGDVPVTIQVGQASSQAGVTIAVGGN